MNSYLVGIAVSIIVGVVLSALSMGEKAYSFKHWPETVAIFLIVGIAVVYSISIGSKESYYRDPWSFNEWQREREFNILSGDSAYMTEGTLNRNQVSGLAEM